MKKLKILFTNNSQLILRGLKSGFDNFKHDTYVMTGKYQLWDKSKKQQLELFKQAIEEYKVDLVFSECFANFSEEVFLHTKERGIPHFFWSIEDTPHEHWIGDHWSEYADHIFTTTAECLPNYWSKGKNAELMLFACNLDFHKPMNIDISHDMTLVANNYDRRSEQTKNFILPLVEKGFDISIFGNEWWMDKNKSVNLINYPDTYKGYGAYEDLSKLYCSSKIVIGQNSDGDSVTQTSMRPFEALGIAGGLLISPYTQAQEYLFHDHIYLPKTTDEMIMMVNEVLFMSDKQRKSKAKKAQQFVYKYHNYNLRAQQILDVYHGK